MSNLTNAKKIMFEIAQTLGRDEVIQKLLLNDNENALTTDNIYNWSVDDLIKQEYINIHYTPENAIKNNTKNTFLVINMPNGYLNNNIWKFDITILLSTNLSHLYLENNQSRLIELMDRIIILLNNKKLSAGGLCTVESFNEFLPLEFSYGYELKLKIENIAESQVLF